MIKILKTTRTQDVLFPPQLIRNDKKLCEAIELYVEEQKLDPIFIDDSLAVFKEYFLVAIYEEDIIVP